MSASQLCEDISVEFDCTAAQTQKYEMLHMFSGVQF